jgi:hypothetical protein
MPRYFTVDECQAVLPVVEEALRTALFHRKEYQRADAELKASTERIRNSGGVHVDRGAFLATRARRDASAAAIGDAMERIERAGAVVKDLDIGLIDFLTLYQDREVYICWKLGEEKIAWWHAIDEGFRGRKPIDEDFLREHGSDGLEDVH